jgi:hypothetical protein
MYSVPSKVEEGKPATQIVGLNGTGVGVLGDAEPSFQMNTYNDIGFLKNFNLRFLLHWKKGGDNVNLTYLQTDFRTNITLILIMSLIN